MLRKKRHLLCLCLLILIAVFFTGCSSIDQLKVKFGMKNNDFEYIKQGKIKKIVIQNTRDPGFRFIVTDKKAISELYDILSTSKQVQTKSTLEPDYVFEMQESSSKVYKFNYITGLDKSEAGNLYNEDKVYVVSKRIDNDIIKSLWNIRKPKDFSSKYYETIINQVEKYYKENGAGKTIGINLYDDVDVAKFILSTDLENFKTNLNSKVPGAELMSTPKVSEKAKDYDITVGVKTVGYKTFLYKTEITFLDKKSNTQKKYYIRISDESKDGRWTTKVDTDRPTGW
ncbi:hypothetical protein JK636_09825 [Clostridium sp. YIM B02515]|uniref:YhfM-like domain-containing protein n=1 Tax=Clostridium rhizosphaerae TaxID=2803861 RepID=A0ABS1T9P0_9CLOT|nr:hypothetical protein [Clostridium rhizosphaerae]